MIKGLGTDIVSIRRMERMLARWGERLTERLFTKEEFAACRDRVLPHVCLAGRFAAKEAFLKALGTGLSGGIGWRDVEVVVASDGRPFVRLHRRAREIFTARGLKGVHVSIAHNGSYGIATVIIEA